MLVFWHRNDIVKSIIYPMNYTPETNRGPLPEPEVEKSDIFVDDDAEPLADISMQATKKNGSTRHKELKKAYSEQRAGGAKLEQKQEESERREKNAIAMQLFRFMGAYHVDLTSGYENREIFSERLRFDSKEIGVRNNAESAFTRIKIFWNDVKREGKSKSRDELRAEVLLSLPVDDSDMKRLISEDGRDGTLSENTARLHVGSKIYVTVNEDSEPVVNFDHSHDQVSVQYFWEKGEDLSPETLNLTESASKHRELLSRALEIVTANKIKEQEEQLWNEVTISDDHKGPDHEEAFNGLNPALSKGDRQRGPVSELRIMQDRKGPQVYTDRTEENPDQFPIEHNTHEAPHHLFPVDTEEVITSDNVSEQDDHDIDPPGEIDGRATQSGFFKSLWNKLRG